MDPNSIRWENFPIYDIPTSLPKVEMGSEDKSFWVCLEEKEFENPETMTFLGRVLDAALPHWQKKICLWKIPDKEKVQFGAALAAANAKTIVVFGVTPDQMGLQITHHLFRPFEWMGHRILFSKSLEIVSGDQETKKNLWMSLQSLTDQK